VTRQRIVFVDDEPQLLGGLRRMLWDRREVWDMRFAEGGPAALAMLEEGPADLVVSDVRMPGMDGPELLERVRQRWPGTVRMILSGHSDREFVYRSIKPAHQFLSKPCSPQELKAAIDRVLKLRDIFTDERLRGAVARIDALPVLPAVFAELTEELRSPNASPRSLGDILARDVGLAAGLLKLVNSSFFGLPRRVSSTEQAVTLLGLDTVRALVLSHGLFSRFDGQRYPGFTLSRLWNHSLGTARLAKQVAALEAADKATQDVCFMAGLVHDAGKLILAELFQTQYAQALDTARGRNITIFEAEMEVFGVSHAAIGAYLLGLWGFEEAVVLGVARHHQPGLAGPDAPLSVAAVHAANAFEHELVVINNHYAPHPLDAAALAAMGLSGRLDIWRESCRELLLQGAALE
jgi:HD-like signal output (HDOD) protein/CheY-like chemotaxis protein